MIKLNDTEQELYIILGESKLILIQNFLSANFLEYTQVIELIKKDFYNFLIMKYKRLLFINNNLSIFSDNKNITDNLNIEKKQIINFLFNEDYFVILTNFIDNNQYAKNHELEIPESDFTY